MRTRRWFGVVLVATVAGNATAQGTGVIAGHIRDATTGIPVAAEVMLDSARRVRANEQGAYRFDGVRPGQRTIHIRFPGFVPSQLVATVHPESVSTLDASLEQAIVPLGAVVVTAARREQRLADAIVETELIAAPELRRSGASDVASAITERAGIQLDGGVPAGAGAQIRGFDSRRVLVLLDGQPMTGRLNGNFDLSRLPLGAVERIEVVKGPQSTLYGSDAIGGVINIITRRPPEQDAFTGALQSTVGSVGRREVAGEAGWRHGEWSAIVNGGHRGIDLTPGVAGDAGTLARRWDANGTLRWEPDSSHRYEVGTLWIGERQRYRTGQLFHFADNTQLASHLTSVIAVGSGRLTSSLALSRFDHLSRASTLGEPVADSGAKDLQTLGTASLLYSRPTRAGAVDAGIDVRQEQISADRVVADVTRIRSVEPFVQVATTLGAVQLSPGVRVTSSDRWGQFVAPRLAAMWRPYPSLALRATAGRGFRAPDFKELYYDFVNASAGYAVRGNADLKPEESTSISLGFEWDGAEVYAHASLFANDYRNFIEFGAPDAAGVYTYGNIDRGQTRGIEGEAGVFVGRWRLDGSAAWTHTKDNATGLPLLGRPASTLRLTADGPLVAGLRASLTSAWVGRTPIDRSAAGGTTERAAYARSDARITRSLPGDLEASIGVTNLFDKQLGVSWPGYTGRQLFASLSWRGTMAR